MNQQQENGQFEDAAATGWRRHLATAEIVAANAVPVVGVWFLGWNSLRPIFFYWLDGLLALLGLGVVASVVALRDTPVKAAGFKLLLQQAAVFILVAAILSIPSVLTALFLVHALSLNPWEFLQQIFTGWGIWFSLLIVIWSAMGQTIGELRWKPSLTLKQSGKERANLFFHRTLLMGFLAAWSSFGQPPGWLLATYVLLVACLYTYTQLYPERYLSLIGFKTKKPDKPPDSASVKKARKR